MNRSFRLRGSLAAVCAVAFFALPGWSQESETPAAEVSPAELSARLESMNEQMQTVQADVDKMKKIRFSGYAQARWEHGEDQSDSVRVSAGTVTPANKERFYIRRARLKMTYDSSPLSQAVVYFDGGQDRTIRLLEAYVTLLDPWTPDHRHGLTAGQFNVPFGYELERSSSVRELPERSRAENTLFSGERDRGLKLVSQWTPQFETVVSVLNGGGVNSTNYPTTDPTSSKDFVARARYSQGVIDGAVSWYSGKEITPLTGPDVSTDKTRFGADAQIYYALPTVGGGSMKGEFFSGQNINADSLRVLVPAPAAGGPTLLRSGANSDHLATDFTGFYVIWVQNLGEKLQFAGRYDAFDPNTDLDHDQYERIGLGLNWFWDGFTRITAAYDVQTTDRLVSGKYIDPKDNLWTVQFQHKF